MRIPLRFSPAGEFVNAEHLLTAIARPLATLRDQLREGRLPLAGRDKDSAEHKIGLFFVK